MFLRVHARALSTAERDLAITDPALSLLSHVTHAYLKSFCEITKGSARRKIRLRLGRFSRGYLWSIAFPTRE